MVRRFLYIFLIFSLTFSLAFAQKNFIYFSFDRSSNKYYIGIEGIFHKDNKILDPNSLNYEWILFFEKSNQSFTTHKPLLVVESNENLVSGRVRVYSNDLSFDQNFNFVFKTKAVPVVSIVRYLEESNVIFPYGKIEGKEKLFPLTFNFSSKNLSIVWEVLKKFYYSVLFDPEGLNNGTEIKLIVTNIDNPREFGSDIIKIER